MEFNNYKVEGIYQEIASEMKYYQLPSDRLKERKNVHTCFPLVHKNSVEMNDIRSFVYSDAYARYLSYRGFNVMYSVGLNNTSKKIYDSVLDNVLSKDDPYTNLKNKSYDDLKKMDLMFDENRKIESHSKTFIKFIQDSFLKLSKFNHVIKEGNDFYLSFDSIKEEVIHELNKDAMFDDIKEELNYKVGLSVNLKTSINIDLEIILAVPEYICGINFIALKPSVFAKKFYLESELEYISNSIKNKKNIGIFSGNMAFNPVTNEYIPIIISNHFKENVYIGNASIRDNDLLFSSVLGLEYNNVISKEKTLINSGFLNGMKCDEAREVVVSYLVENYDAKAIESFDTKILISTEFEDGIAIPSYEDELVDINDLPVLIDNKNSVRTLKNQLCKRKFSDKVFTTNITQAFLNVVTRVIDKTGITNYSSREFVFEFKDYPKYDYVIFHNKAEYFFTLVLNMILLKSINEDYKNIYNKFYILPELHDTKNIIELNAILMKYGACSLRGCMLSIPLDDNYYYNEDEVVNKNKLINKFISIYEYEFSSDVKDLEKTFNNLLIASTTLIENNDFQSFISLISQFVDKVHEYKKITSRQAKGLLVLFSVIAPSICESINERRFKKGYPLLFSSWPI